MRLRKVKNLEQRMERFRGGLLLEPKPLVFADIFGNQQPVVAEFGTGRGEFILMMARRQPELNFLGVERVDSVLIQAMEKVEGETNLRYLRANVEDLDDVIQESSLSGLYLNFSDPWPKKKNRKRRLTHRGYLERYDRWLQEHSMVQLKTDSKTLFAFSIEEISQTGHMLEDVTLDITQSPAYEDNIQTEYEERFTAEGHPIYALRYHSKKVKL